jgi:hypothetical protein
MKKSKKISLIGLKQLSRAEMKKIMAGSGNICPPGICSNACFSAGCGCDEFGFCMKPQP